MYTTPGTPVTAQRFPSGVSLLCVFVLSNTTISCLYTEQLQLSLSQAAGLSAPKCSAVAATASPTRPPATFPRESPASPTTSALLQVKCLGMVFISLFKIRAVWRSVLWADVSLWVQVCQHRRCLRHRALLSCKRLHW